MPVKDIVSCWITRSLPPGNALDTIVHSLHEAGFSTAKQKGSDRVRLKRGSQVGGFAYDSEGLEVQVIVEHDANGDLTIHVGNWGFPFEPLLMKDRFRRLADRLERDIRTHGRVLPASNENDEVEAAKTQTRSNAIKIALIAAPLGAIAGFVLVRLIGN